MVFLLQRRILHIEGFSILDRQWGTSTLAFEIHGV